MILKGNRFFILMWILSSAYAGWITVKKHHGGAANAGITGILLGLATAALLFPLTFVLAFVLLGLAYAMSPEPPSPMVFIAYTIAPAVIVSIIIIVGDFFFATSAAFITKKLFKN